MPELGLMGAHFLFRNSSVVVVDKPAGVLSVPPRFADSRRILGRELETELGTAIFPVHRLDFEVSGVIAYALNREAHKILNRAFEKHLMQKTYTAFTDPVRAISEWTKADARLTPETQIWESRIERGKRRSFESPRGVEARTEARCLGPYETAKGEKYLEWELKPLTGRPHQLRFELGQRGYPIWGDELYGSKRTWPAKDAIALRAVRLEFPAEVAEALALPAFVTAAPLVTASGS